MKKEVEYIEYKEETFTTKECIKYAIMFYGVILAFAVYYISFDPYYMRDYITVPILKLGLVLYIPYFIGKKVGGKRK